MPTGFVASRHRVVPSSSARLAALRALLTGLLSLAGGEAWGHTDPGTCNRADVRFTIVSFRADGVTPIGSGTVSPCETIIYRVVLSKEENPAVCAFQGGRIVIRTPDGVSYDATPPGGIPCIGGTDGVICDPTETEIMSEPVAFTVDPADLVDDQVVATASYGIITNGVCASDCPAVHLGSDLAAYGVGLATGSSVTFCPASTRCQISLCDPNLTDGIRTGLCSTSNLPNGTACKANACSCQDGVCIAAGGAHGRRRRPLCDR